jgi:hypothetical protein
MVYNTQNYWGFRLSLSSGILESRKQNVSETGPVSETFCFLVSRIPDDGQIRKTQYFCVRMFIHFQFLPYVTISVYVHRTKCLHILIPENSLLV